MAPIAISGQCPSSSADPAIAKLRADAAQVSLPVGFHAVAAVRCETVVRTVAGDGEWQFADALRADSGLAALLAALGQPSETPPTGMYACTAIGVLVPDFGLVDATGRVIRPRLPQTACGQPLPQVLTAVNNLPWRTETEQRVSQTQNQQEIDSGCYPQYKDVFEIPQPASPLPWSKVRPPVSNGPAMACLYAVAHTSNALTDGDDFVRGTALDSAQQSSVGRALSLVGDSPAPTCSATATRFVVLFVPSAAGVAVELDGCKRVLWPDGFMAPAPAGLLQAVAALGLG